MSQFSWEKFVAICRTVTDLVCQVAGSKQWTLLPPSASPHLSPSLAPYEESSVYSRVNMVSLEHNYQHLLDMKYAYCLISAE